MEVVVDDIWLCTDCTLYAVNDDLTGIEAEDRANAVRKGVHALGRNLVPDFDAGKDEGIEEFSRKQCDGCGTRLHGERHRFAVLG